MTECKECGEHVSDRFARVMGDNDGRVWRCPNCAPNALGNMAGGVEHE